MNVSDFFEIDEPEIDEEFLQSTLRAILCIEHMNMWKVSFKDFRLIVTECDRIVRSIKEYEKWAKCEFVVFREVEKRIEKQRERCKRTKFSVGYGSIPWSER